MKAASTAAASATGIPQPVIEKGARMIGRHWRALAATIVLLPSALVFFIVLSAGTFKPTSSFAASCVSAAQAASVATTATAGPTPPPDQLSLFMAAERWQESRNNYTEPGNGAVWNPTYNGIATPSDYKGAFGAYQFEQPTWYSYANLAGYPQYEDTNPTTLPPAIQDAVANTFFTSHYQGVRAMGYPGNIWLYVAEMTIYPADANPAGQNVVVPGNNGGITVGEYGASVVSYMTSEPWVAAAASASSTTTTIPSSSCGATGPAGPLSARIVSLALAQVGKNQAAGNGQWGPSGESWCSFFSTWVWAQAGVQPPTPSLGYSGDPWKWTQAHAADGGVVLPRSATPLPGDMIFFGTGYANHGSEHVAIVTQVFANGNITIVGGNSGNGTNYTSTVMTSLPFNPADAAAEGFPGPVWAYAQPPGLTTSVV